MTAYKNFSLDLPERIFQLDKQFSPIAEDRQLEVSYLLMKLGAAFILPHERVDGSSGARMPKEERQNTRKYLELDKKFRDSRYCHEHGEWDWLEVQNFSLGPNRWTKSERPVHRTVQDVLKVLRHAIAHSNLFFGGDRVIEDIYFGAAKERNVNNDEYKVVRCRVDGMNQLVDAWIENLRGTKVRSSVILDVLDKAA